MFLGENKARDRFVILLVWLSIFIAASYGNCGVPPRLDFAILEDQFIGQNDFPVNASVTYVCLPGYIRNPKVQNIILCLSDSTWSTVETFCLRRSCENPRDIENGDIHYDNVFFGSRITYTCHTGYNMLSKLNYRKCLADGTWSNEVPVCEVQICMPPYPITDGSYDPIKEEYTYQEAVTYQCNDKKYALLGESSVVCTTDGNWSPDPPVCVDVECPRPYVDNAKIVSGVIGPYYYNYVVRFECSPGFTMKGATSVKCLAHKQWDPPLPTCSKGYVAAVMVCISDACGVPCRTPLQSRDISHRESESYKIA